MYAMRGDSTRRDVWSPVDCEATVDLSTAMLGACSMHGAPGEQVSVYAPRVYMIEHLHSRTQENSTIPRLGTYS